MNNRIPLLCILQSRSATNVSALVISVRNSNVGASLQSLNASSRRSSEASLAADRDDKTGTTATGSNCLSFLKGDLSFGKMS